MVSIWLTMVNSGQTMPKWRTPAFSQEAGFRQMQDNAPLLAILLNAGGPQACKTMLINRKLPGQEFVDRQGVAAASLLKREQATTNRGNDFGLAADDPPFCPGRGQIRNC
jgi:hypothetical protein